MCKLMQAIGTHYCTFCDRTNSKALTSPSGFNHFHRKSRIWLCFMRPLVNSVEKQTQRISKLVQIRLIPNVSAETFSMFMPFDSFQFLDVTGHTQLYLLPATIPETRFVAFAQKCTTPLYLTNFGENFRLVSLEMM